MTEKSSFIEALGDSAKIRILDFFITFREFDYSLSQISENAGVSWATTLKLVAQFKKKGILTETRKIGRARMFSLNTKDPVVKALIVLFNSVCNEAVDRCMAQKITFSKSSDKGIIIET